MAKKKTTKKKKNTQATTSKTVKSTKKPSTTKPTSSKAETKVSASVVSKVSSTEPTTTESSAISKIWQNYRNHPHSLKRTLATVFGVLTIAGVVWFNFYAIPNLVLTQTDAERAEQEAKEQEEERLATIAEAERRLEVENQVLDFEANTTWQTEIEFGSDLGNLRINLQNNYAPETVENFVRLAYRDYFSNMAVHEIIKTDGFNAIYTGDGETKTGQGGKSAFYINDEDEGLIPDEQWLTEPEFRTEGEVNVLANQPELRTPSLYGDFRADDGTITVPKGTVLMFREGIDVGTSQFFITLTESRIPAIYTAFGTVPAEDFPVLDKIYNNYNPVTLGVDDNGEEAKTPAKDGIGSVDPELQINTIRILSPDV
jgi:cyclophilin family peptidyl-prolyl cis-trans isomerase